MADLVFDRWPEQAAGTHTVWFFGGLSPAFQGNAVPDVDIWLRGESVGGEHPAFVRWPLPLTHAALLPVGSKVSRGVLQKSPPWQAEVFKVSFADGGWQYRRWSDWLGLGAGRMDPFGAGGYPLPPQVDQSWWLEFSLENDRKLLVPCMEFLLRAYLRDKETLRKTLLYRGGERDERLYGVTGPPQPGGPWRVPLAHGIRNDDVVFLAHLRHDPYTQMSVRQLVTQMDAARRDTSVDPVLLQVRPWFAAESVKLRARGSWLEEKQTFVCLSLLGCSEPPGPAIDAEREKTEKVAAGGQSDPDRQGMPRRVLMGRPNAVDLISHGEPGYTAPTLAIEEEHFEILATDVWREVCVRQRIVRQCIRPTPAGAPSPIDAGHLDGFGTGEPGTGKNLGRGSIYAPTCQKSRGILEDMWRSFVLLRERSESIVRAVEVMDKECNFNVADDPEPYLGLLTAQEMSASKFKGNTRWALIDPDAESPVPRAVMFVRLVTPKSNAYFVELERRVRKIDNVTEDDASPGPSVTEIAECRGLAFTLHPGHDLRFMAIATFILTEIVRHKGVMHKVAEAFAEHSISEIPKPRRLYAFKHTNPDEQGLYSDRIEKVLEYLFGPTPP